MLHHPHDHDRQQSHPHLPHYCPANTKQPSEWRITIDEADRLKIRRLLLEKLFKSWQINTYDLRQTRCVVLAN